MVNYNESVKKQFKIKEAPLIKTETNSITTDKFFKKRNQSLQPNQIGSARKHFARKSMNPTEIPFT